MVLGVVVQVSPRFRVIVAIPGTIVPQASRFGKHRIDKNAQTPAICPISTLLDGVILASFWRRSGLARDLAGTTSLGRRAADWRLDHGDHVPHAEHPNDRRIAFLERELP